MEKREIKVLNWQVWVVYIMAVMQTILAFLGLVSTRHKMDMSTALFYGMYGIGWFVVLFMEPIRIILRLKGDQTKMQKSLVLRRGFWSLLFIGQAILYAVFVR